MMTWFVVVGGIALVVGTITLLDWLGGRQRLRREAQAREVTPREDASHAQSAAR